MKLDATKFAFALSTTLTLLVTITNLFPKLTLFNQVFIPTPPTRARMPHGYPFGLSLFSIFLLFAFIFVVAWFFAKLYNNMAQEQ